MARNSVKSSPVSSKEAEKHVAAPTANTVAHNGPSYEQIARRAYEIFVARGSTHGNHEQDWFQAERELRLGRQ